MKSSKLVGSYSESGKVTQVDKYGNVTCETVCVVLKVIKTCDKDNVYLVSAEVGKKTYNALIVKHNNDDSTLWYGQGNGALLHINFNTDDDSCKSVDFRLSSYNSGNNENWSACNLTLKACKCYKKDLCGCDCERS
jgi:hypothetical protein